MKHPLALGGVPVCRQTLWWTWCCYNPDFNPHCDTTSPLFIYVFMYLFIYLGEKSPCLLPVHHIVAGPLVSSPLPLGTCGMSPVGGI